MRIRNNPGSSFGVILPIAICFSMVAACQETVPPMVYSKSNSINQGVLPDDNSNSSSADAQYQSSTGSSDSSLPNDNTSLPDNSTPDNNQDALTSTATFSQRPGGLLTHPDLKGGAPISGGVMNVRFAPQQMSLSITGMDTSKSEARKGVRGMNGTTLFNRVLYADTPDQPKYRDHPYLIFANALTNKDSQTFTIKSPGIVPIYAAAKDSIDAYKNLLWKGRVKYPVTVIGPGGGEVPLTFVVTRALDGNLPSCTNNPFGVIENELDQVQKNVGVKIVVQGIPQAWQGKFPMTDTIFVNNFANGGTTKAIANCRTYYDSKQRKTGTVKLEFAN